MLCETRAFTYDRALSRRRESPGRGNVATVRRQFVEKPVALGATMYVFEIRLADADRGVYETLTIRVARHPSETAEYLVTRLLAYCLEYTEGIAFSKGLSDPDEPAISVRDLTGALQAWIEVGAPDAGRLHKAAKAAPKVTVYAHRDVGQLLSRLAGERIHRAEALRIRTVDRELLAALVARLDRRMSLDLAVSDNTLYVSLGEETLTGVVDDVARPDET